MGESTKNDAVSARMRWNDIRVVGPMLVVALFMAALISPQFATAEQSVGGGYYPYDCFGGSLLDSDFNLASAQPATDSANAEAERPIRERLRVGPCCGGFELAEATAAVGVVLKGDFIDPCCTDASPSPAGAFLLSECPTPGVLLQPFTPPPPPVIEGPIWLGATVSIVADGSVHFLPPTLLAMMIDANAVTITDADGDVVFHGRVIPGSPIVTGISSVTGAGDYTMTAILKTGAKYTEVVTVG